MKENKRFTERTKFGGVRYEDRDGYITCYPESEENDAVDKMAIRLCELEDEKEGNKKILAYKVLSDSTLISETKADLIERIRILEHNWSCAEESLANSVKNSDKIFYAQEAEIERLTDTLNQYMIGELVNEDVFVQQVKDIQQAVKDTAREIFGTVKDLYIEDTGEEFEYTWFGTEIMQFAKEKYGVEVE